MLKTRHLHILLLSLSLCAGLSHRATAGSVASNLMSQAMITMMDAMGEMAHGYRNRGDSGWGGWQGMNAVPWSAYAVPGMTALSGSGIPGQAQMQELASQAPQSYIQGQSSLQDLLQQPTYWRNSDPSPLNGIWQGQQGEIVLVMYGHFRVYASPDVYRDGDYEIRDGYIIMRDPKTGMQKPYEYVLDKGRMVMRDSDGDLLLFRQMPIPVPTYDVFSGQQPITPQISSTQQGKSNKE